MLNPLSLISGFSKGHGSTLLLAGAVLFLVWYIFEQGKESCRNSALNAGAKQSEQVRKDIEENEDIVKKASSLDIIDIIRDNGGIVFND